MKKLIFTSILTLAISASYATTDDKTIDISYVKSPFNIQLMVMKEKQLLEKQAEALGVKVKWHEITSGAKQAQALASGDLDIGGVMNTASVLMANGAGNPVKIIAGVSRPTGTFAIVATKDGVNSIAELKGKKIAGPKGTVLHQILVAALAKNQMTIDDVEFIQMDIPQAFSALQSKQVDAALLAASAMIKAEHEGANVLTNADGLAVPKLVMTTSQRNVEEHPEWINAAINAHNQAAEWIAEHQDEAIALGAKIQGISNEDAKILFTGAHITQLLNQTDIDSMKEDIQFLLDNNMLSSEPDVSEIILPQALEQTRDK